MKMHYWMAAAAVTATGLSACDSATSSSASSGGGTASVATVDQFQAAFSAGICDAMFRCKSQVEMLPVATKEGCSAMFSSLQEGMGGIVADVHAGKVKYDAAAAAKCLELFKGDCSGLTSMKESGVCASAFVGLVATGQDCANDQQCASGWCKKKDSVCSVGTCTAKIAKDGDCTSDTDVCAEAGQICVLPKCQSNTPAKVGEDCGMGKDCDSTSFCDFDTQKCKALKAVGAECMSSGDCQSPATCMKNAAGKSVCTAPGKEGEACKSSVLSSTCATGLVCVANTSGEGKCQKPVAVGAACTTSNECGGLDVGCIGKVCKVLPTKGGACTPPDVTKGDFFTCLLPYVCVGNTCAEAPKEGEKCAPGMVPMCAMGLMCGKDALCHGKPTAGQACDGECAPDLTCKYDNEGKATCVAATCK